MIKGLYTSALGMTTQMKRMDVVANNIANANTTGFKRDMVATQSFSAELAKRLDDPATPAGRDHDTPMGKMSMGVFVDTVYTDFSTGSLTSTGGAYDLAILDGGFFTVATENGIRYTRDGSFTVNAERTLVTKDGYAVQGQGGNITVPQGFVTIAEDGGVYVNGEFVDRLRLADFENLDTLRKIGANLYNTTGDSVEKPMTGFVQQGAIENSNINPVREMVEMIALSRAYETNQRMIGIHDTMLGRAVTDIGRR